MRAGTDTRPRLLLTRPKVGSERFARAARARLGEDWPITIAPLLETEPTGAALPAANVLIFTSEQAVGPVARSAAHARMAAFCVGTRTAEVARRAGFNVRDIAPNAETLCAQILAAPDCGMLLHARGNESAFPLAERLSAQGRSAREAIVYAQKPQPLTAEARQLLDGTAPLLVPIFSPNSGRLLAAAAPDAQAPLRVVAISQAAAAACSGLPVETLHVAPTPTAEALLDVLVALSPP